MKKTWRSVRLLLLWTALALALFVGSAALIPPSEKPAIPARPIEVWTARTLSFFGVRNAWIDDVRFRDGFEIVDVDPAAMEFDDGPAPP
jgi:hypothetical protein